MRKQCSTSIVSPGFPIHRLQCKPGRQPGPHAGRLLSYGPASLLFVWLVIILCLLPQQLWAIPIPTGSQDHKLKIELTVTSAFEYHTRNPEAHRSAHSFKYFDLQNRLNLDITYNQFRIGGRVDTFNFFEDQVPCDTKFPDCQARYVPEKLYFQVQLGAFDFIVGDFYLTVGRGIALSIRKVDEFGIDTSLRGGRITYEKKGFRGTIAGGFSNINNMDPVRETFMEDPNQFIFAAEASQRIADFFSIGAHYVYANLQGSPDENNAVFIANSHIVGGSLRFPDLWKRVDFGFEGNFQLKQNGNAQDTGFAMYTHLNVYLFPVTLSMEGQWYQNFTLPADVPSRYSKVTAPPILYNNAPSLERQDLDTQGDNTNSKGVRVRLDYTLPSRTSVFHVNYMFRYGFVPPNNKIEQLMIHNIFAGGEHRWGIVNLKYSGGIREINGFEIWRLLHFDLDASVRFLRQNSIELVGRYWWNRKSEGIEGEPDRLYHIADLQLGYAFAKWVSVSVLFSYSDEFPAPDFRQFYIAAEVKVKLWRYGAIKFFGGFARGGLRCISGVCRIFPPFEGIRAELTFRL